MNGIRHDWKLVLTEGVILIAAGVVAIVIPQLITKGIELLIGILLVIAGAVQALRSLRAEGLSKMIFPLATGLVALVAGVLLLAHPKAGILTLTIILTIVFVVGGIAKLIMAAYLRETSIWGWFVISGLIGIVLAGIVWASLPGSSYWLMGLLLGIDLIFFGLARAALALSSRP